MSQQQEQNPSFNIQGVPITTVSTPTNYNVIVVPQDQLKLAMPMDGLNQKNKTHAQQSSQQPSTPSRDHQITQPIQTIDTGFDSYAQYSKKQDQDNAQKDNDKDENEQVTITTIKPQTIKKIQRNIEIHLKRPAKLDKLFTDDVNELTTPIKVQFRDSLNRMVENSNEPMLESKLRNNELLSRNSIQDTSYVNLAMFGGGRDAYNIDEDELKQQFQTNQSKPYNDQSFLSGEHEVEVPLKDTIITVNNQSSKQQSSPHLDLGIDGKTMILMNNITSNSMMQQEKMNPPSMIKFKLSKNSKECMTLEKLGSNEDTKRSIISSDHDQQIELIQKRTEELQSILDDKDVSDKQYFLKKEYLSKQSSVDKRQTISFNDFKKSYDSVSFKNPSKTFKIKFPNEVENQQSMSPPAFLSSRSSSRSRPLIARKAKNNVDLFQLQDPVGTLNRNTIVAQQSGVVTNTSDKRGQARFHIGMLEFEPLHAVKGSQRYKEDDKYQSSHQASTDYHLHSPMNFDKFRIISGSKQKLQLRKEKKDQKILLSMDQEKQKRIINYHKFIPTIGGANLHLESLNPSSVHTNRDQRKKRKSKITIKQPQQNNKQQRHNSSSEEDMLSQSISKVCGYLQQQPVANGFQERHDTERLSLKNSEIYNSLSPTPAHKDFIDQAKQVKIVRSPQKKESQDASQSASYRNLIQPQPNFMKYLLTQGNFHNHQAAQTLRESHHPRSHQQKRRPFKKYRSIYRRTAAGIRDHHRYKSEVELLCRNTTQGHLQSKEGSMNTRNATKLLSVINLQEVNQENSFRNIHMQIGSLSPVGSQDKSERQIDGAQEAKSSDLRGRRPIEIQGLKTLNPTKSEQRYLSSSNRVNPMHLELRVINSSRGSPTQNYNPVETQYKGQNDTSSISNTVVNIERQTPTKSACSSTVDVQRHNKGAGVSGSTKEQFTFESRLQKNSILQPLQELHESVEITQQEITQQDVTQQTQQDLSFRGGGETMNHSRMYINNQSVTKLNDLTAKKTLQQEFTDPSNAHEGDKDTTDVATSQRLQLNYHIHRANQFIKQMPKLEKHLGIDITDLQLNQSKTFDRDSTFTDSTFTGNQMSKLNTHFTLKNSFGSSTVRRQKQFLNKFSNRNNRKLKASLDKKAANNSSQNNNNQQSMTLIGGNPSIGAILPVNQDLLMLDATFTSRSHNMNNEGSQNASAAAKDNKKLNVQIPDAYTNMLSNSPGTADKIEELNDLVKYSGITEAQKEQILKFAEQVQSEQQHFKALDASNDDQQNQHKQEAPLSLPPKTASKSQMPPPKTKPKPLHFPPPSNTKPMPPHLSLPTSAMPLSSHISPKIGPPVILIATNAVKSGGGGYGAAAGVRSPGKPHGNLLDELKDQMREIEAETEKVMRRQKEQELQCQKRNIIIKDKQCSFSSRNVAEVVIAPLDIQGSNEEKQTNLNILNLEPGSEMPDVKRQSLKSPNYTRNSMSVTALPNRARMMQRSFKLKNRQSNLCKWKNDDLKHMESFNSPNQNRIMTSGSQLKKGELLNKANPILSTQKTLKMKDPSPEGIHKIDLMMFQEQSSHGVVTAKHSVYKGGGHENKEQTKQQQQQVIDKNVNCFLVTDLENFVENQRYMNLKADKSKQSGNQMSLIPSKLNSQASISVDKNSRMKANYNQVQNEQEVEQKSNINMKKIEQEKKKYVQSRKSMGILNLKVVKDQQIKQSVDDIQSNKTGSDNVQISNREPLNIEGQLQFSENNQDPEVDINRPWAAKSDRSTTNYSKMRSKNETGETSYINSGENKMDKIKSQEGDTTFNSQKTSFKKVIKRGISFKKEQRNKLKEIRVSLRAYPVKQRQSLTTKNKSYLKEFEGKSIHEMIETSLSSIQKVNMQNQKILEKLNQDLSSVEPIGNLQNHIITEQLNKDQNARLQYQRDLTFLQTRDAFFEMRQLEKSIQHQTSYTTRSQSNFQSLLCQKQKTPLYLKFDGGNDSSIHQQQSHTTPISPTMSYEKRQRMLSIQYRKRMDHDRVRQLIKQ